MAKLTYTKFSKTNPDDVNRLSLLMKQLEMEEQPGLSLSTIDYFKLRLKAPERLVFRDDFYFIRKQDEIIGFLQFRTNKVSDLNQFYIGVFIVSEHRNKYYAKQSLVNFRDIIPEGVDIIITSTYKSAGEEDPPLVELIKNMGGKHVYTENVNVSQLHKFDKEEIRRTATQLEETANNAGYRFIYIEEGDHQNHPDIDYPQYLEMVGKIWNDMPTEEGSWEEEPINEEIYQGLFDYVKQRGGHVWTVAAVHEETKQAVGVTDISYFNSIPGYVEQGDTGVAVEHRGHRIGKTLKYLMLDKILNDKRLEYGKYWVTGNANSNEHMQKINHELKYEMWYQVYWYEIPLERYLGWLEAKQNMSQ